MAAGEHSHLFDPESDLDAREEPVQSAATCVSLVCTPFIVSPIIQLVLVTEYERRLDRNVIRTSLLYLLGAVQFNQFG